MSFSSRYQLFAVLFLFKNMSLIVSDVMNSEKNKTLIFKTILNFVFINY